MLKILIAIAPAANEKIVIENFVKLLRDENFSENFTESFN